MGLFKKKIVKKTYDREHMKPVIRASICTGEEVAFPTGAAAIATVETILKAIATEEKA